MPHCISPGLARFFDLNGVHRAVLDNQDIDLFLVTMPVLLEGCLLAAMPVAFEQFADHPRLENGSGHSAGFQCGWAAPFGEVSSQSAVQKPCQSISFQNK